MKKGMLLLFMLIFLGFWSCGSSGPSEAELKAEAEADRLDSLNQLLEVNTEGLEEDAVELQEALEELDELFPEEGE